MKSFFIDNERNCHVKIVLITGLIITGQVITSILTDHFGLFGAEVKTIDIKRAAGALFMIVGIYLVMKK